jgi:hypothetical protein
VLHTVREISGLSFQESAPSTCSVLWLVSKLLSDLEYLISVVPQVQFVLTFH